MKKYLYITFGLPGAGKSTVAQCLLDILPRECIVQISADVMRKKLFPVPRYDKHASKTVWQTCINAVQQAMTEEKVIIWDAVFWHEHRRQEVKKMAQDQGYETVFVYVFCDDESSIKTRLDARTNDPSDADYTVYRALKDSFQYPDPSTILSIDNSGDKSHLFQIIHQTFPLPWNS